jgi:protein arginine kinase activator
MLCELCKEREASVHLTQVIDGSIKKLHLCEECAAKSGVDLQGPLSISDILLGLGVQKEPAGAGSERSCPRCHMRRTDFKKTGRFGCSECYAAFAEELPPLLKAMHRADRHTGKIPEREGARVRAGAELALLQQNMEKAIAGENFEEAALLRDRIQACRVRLDEEEKKAGAS